MAVDYTINLAKELTSTQVERTRFYNRMLIYLVTCSAGLVFVAYLASVNTLKYLENRKERVQLLRTASAVADIDITAFRNPDKIYRDLEKYAVEITALKQALSHRVQLLPVIHNLFVDLPEGVSLQSLSGNRQKLTFGMVMPPPSEEAGDPVQQLRTAWESNEELMTRVATIRPVTGERRTVGSQSVFFVQFECILEK